MQDSTEWLLGVRPSPTPPPQKGLTMERFEDIEPLGPADEPLFAELREVLIRHGAIDRFGVTLLHRHFDIGDGERLVELADARSRTIVIRPAALANDSGESPVPTSWSFRAEQVQPVERLVCWPVKDRDGNIVGHML